MRIFILLSLGLLLGGCQSFNEMLPDEDSSVFEPPPLDYSVPATSSGGLYVRGTAVRCTRTSGQFGWATF